MAGKYRASSSNDKMRYRVVETVQFSDLWQSAIDSGVIDPVAESKLQGLARLLSLNPYYFPLFDPQSTEEMIVAVC